MLTASSCGWQIRCTTTRNYVCMVRSCTSVLAYSGSWILVVGVLGSASFLGSKLHGRVAPVPAAETAFPSPLYLGTAPPELLWRPNFNICRRQPGSKAPEEAVDQCVAEFVVIGHRVAAQECRPDKRTTVIRDDLVLAMSSLGFSDSVSS
ncbi:hypothetical protein BAE44_0008605 [Dichanthelium oligosanthes]|uniref:Transcription factor CBF/NF-Y/archaeal histone domain-containing protein n=1 Tax=Dichanthelium oligosanthes TaxID=888268 RepID=A0A1E5VZ44_9POAL|nr:hypothetical protein BAE44_0008605 [Dichanthelium oligosanthes]